jgi:hypothetical protein
MINIKLTFISPACKIQADSHCIFFNKYTVLFLGETVSCCTIISNTYVYSVYVLYST